jgi:hypothetical protein
MSRQRRTSMRSPGPRPGKSSPPHQALKVRFSGEVHVPLQFIGAPDMQMTMVCKPGPERLLMLYVSLAPSTTINALEETDHDYRSEECVTT